MDFVSNDRIQRIERALAFAEKRRDIMLTFADNKNIDQAELKMRLDGVEDMISRIEKIYIKDAVKTRF